MTSHDTTAGAPAGLDLTSDRRSDRVLERLMALHPKVIDLSLDRLWRLLKALGCPERKLPPVIHVAGTNGKGSLIAYLRAMLEAAGYRVHVYSSPHLVRFNERIRLAGELIPEDALAALLEECEQANGGAPITFFEITTAAAFKAFSQSPADILLLETGLGGRLDATNVLARPRLTAITPVSMDHEQFLGDSLDKIAFEKAGILKEKVPAVIGPQAPAALDVISRRADELSARLTRHGRDWRCIANGAGMLYESAETRLELPRPALPGDHQIDNAGTAIACLEQLPEFFVPDDAIAAGLTSVSWPARLQRLGFGPLVERAPSGAEVWLDGGHNPAAGQALATAFRQMSQTDARPFHLIAGMLNSKEAGGYLAPFAELAESAFAVAILGEANSLTAEELAESGSKAGLAMTPAADLAAAMEAIADRAIANRARAEEGPAPRILIGGSLYLSGRVLAENG